MLRISLDFHDASLFNMHWDMIERLKDRYPKIKLSLFFIPWDYMFEKTLLRLNKDDALDKLKSNLDWIRLYPHGLTHFPQEFEKADVKATKLALDSIDTIFTTYKLPYQKGFCAPYWLWNKEVTRVLDSRGWWGAVDKNQPDMPRTRRFYKYSHSIHEPFWADTEAEVWKLHGHMDLSSENDIEKCFFNLLKIPKDVEWCFIDEFVEGGK